MAKNWPPASGSYPTYPPPGYGEKLYFSSLQVMADFFLAEKFTVDRNPTPEENRKYFQGVRCDEDHPCNGVMLVSPDGLRYPVPFCTGGTHKSGLYLLPIGYDDAGKPCYDLGWGSGVIA